MHLCLKSETLEHAFLGWIELIHTLRYDPPLIHSLCIVMLYFKSDKGKLDLQMAQCDRCQAWHHRKCVKMPVSVFRKKSQFWICPKRNIHQPSS